MSVDVADLFGPDSSIHDGIDHYPISSVPILRGLGDVKGVSRHSVTNDFRINGGSPLFGHFQFF